MEEVLKGTGNLVKKNSHLLIAGVASYCLYQADSQLHSESRKSREYEARINELEQQLEDERRAKCAAQKRMDELQKAMVLDCRQLINDLELIIKEDKIPKKTSETSWLSFVNAEKSVSSIHSECSNDDDGSKSQRLGRATEKSQSFRAESALFSLSTMVDNHSFEPKDRAKYILLCLLNAYEVYLDDELFIDDSLAVTPLQPDMIAHFKEKIAEDFDIDDKIERATANREKNLNHSEDDYSMSNRLNVASLANDDDDDEDESEAVKGVQEWENGGPKQQSTEASLNDSAGRNADESNSKDNSKRKESGRCVSLLSNLICYIVWPLILVCLVIELTSLLPGKCPPCPIPPACPIPGECPECDDCPVCTDPLRCLEDKNDCALSLRQCQVQIEESQVEFEQCEKSKSEASKGFEEYLSVDS